MILVCGGRAFLSWSVKQLKAPDPTADRQKEVSRCLGREIGKRWGGKDGQMDKRRPVIGMP